MSSVIRFSPELDGAALLAGVLDGCAAGAVGGLCTGALEAGGTD